MAGKLGFIDVDAMLQGLFSTQFSEWLNFYTLEPFGAEAEEIHLAAIRAQITNYLRPAKQPPYPLRDFLITFQPPPKEQSVEEMYAKFSC